MYEAETVNCRLLLFEPEEGVVVRFVYLSINCRSVK